MSFYTAIIVVASILKVDIRGINMLKKNFRYLLA